MRASVGVVGGALALAALTAQAAQADGGYGDTSVTKAVVDGGNKVSMGVSSPVSLKAGVTANDDSGIKDAEYFTLIGPDYGIETTGKPVCAAVNSSAGALTRADWESPKYGAYGSQSVKLQFRKKGWSTYSTLKSVTAGPAGNPRTTSAVSARR